MGTSEDISRLQQEIRDGLNRSGVSVDAFARWCFSEETDRDDDVGLVSFVEKFTKQLSRPSSTSRMLATLGRYREILFAHPDFHNKCLLPPRNVTYPELDDDFRRGMKKISKSIDEALKQKALEQEEAAEND